MTHLALRVRDAEESLSFYSRYLGWVEVHRRAQSDGKRIIWVGPPPPAGRSYPELVLVLLEWPFEECEQPPVDHLGIAVASREEVDRVAELARREGRLIFGPKFLDPVAGYLCMVRDPSGNRVEISFGQPLAEREEPA